MEDASHSDLFAPILRSDALMGPLLLTARLFTTGIFVFYTQKVVTNHASSGFLYLAIAVDLFGVLLVALGYKARFAALMMAGSILVTLLFRESIGLPSGFFTTLKVLALASGFFFMFARGPGPLSFDRYRARTLGKLGKNTKANFLSRVFNSKEAMAPLLLVARIVSTLVFFAAGIGKIAHTPVTQAYMMRHNPHVATNLVYLAILTQFIFPVLVLLGYKTRYGALALSGFCIIATALFHAEFGVPSEVEQFLLDFAIAGGFLFMFAQGPGPLSLDARSARSHKTI
jgi:putative oxidoreductase